MTAPTKVSSFIAASLLFATAHAFGQAELAVTTTVSEPTPVEGDEIVFTVSVLNNGPNEATGVLVADQLPPGVTFVGVDTIDQGSYDDGAGLWDVGALVDGASAEIQIRASVDLGAADVDHGAFVDAFVTAGLGGLDRPVGVTVGPDANLYVTSFATNEVLRYDGSNGALLGTFASGPELGPPFASTFGPDGDLYVSSQVTQEVLRYDGATGAFIEVFADAGGLLVPRGLTFGPDGNLYVASGLTAAVLRYNGSTGAFIGAFASGPELDSPAAIAFGPDGRLYVTSATTHEVLAYNGRNGLFDEVFVDAAAGLQTPVGMTFGPDGRLYVSSFGTGDVRRFDVNTGAPMPVFAGGPELTEPQGIAFGPSGDLYVASDNTDEVFRYRGFITNAAATMGNESDPNILNNNDSVAITAVPAPDFEPPAEVPAEGEALIHAVGDLDTSIGSGGTIDVAVVIPDANPALPGVVQIFLNLGNDMGGAWQGLDPQLPTIPVGADPTGIALGDLNSDGYLDFIVSNAGDGTISSFFNAADDSGTFTPGAVVGGLSMPSAVAIGEFGDAPGLDIAIAEEGANQVRILENGILIATIPVVAGPLAIDPRDIDDDKDVDTDLLVAGNGGAVTVILNEPAGAFTPLPDIPVGAGPVDVISADLNLDGTPDVITADVTGGTLTILLNLGPPDGPGPVFAPAITLDAGIAPTSVDAVDLDGDGDVDLAVSGEDVFAGPAVLVFENMIVPTGQLAFEEPVPVLIDADPQYVLSGDFNDDGPPDLVTVNTDADQPTGGSVTVLVNTVFPCPGDIDEDGAVGFGDILTVIGLWGECQITITCEGDLNLDGDVGFADLLLVISNWGACG